MVFIFALVLNRSDRCLLDETRIGEDVMRYLNIVQATEEGIPLTTPLLPPPPSPEENQGKKMHVLCIFPEKIFSKRDFSKEFISITDCNIPESK